MTKMAYWAPVSAHPLLARREEKRVEVIIITSDKGLCGAFNSNLLARVHAFLEEKSREAAIRLVLFGKKASLFFKKQPYPVDMMRVEKVDKMTEEDYKTLAQFLIRGYLIHRIDAVYMIYNEFKSILAPRITIHRLLPLGLPEAGETKSIIPPVWEPGLEDLCDSLLSLFIEKQVEHCFLESQASEHAARMMAMDNAAQNAEELISDLFLVLNKIRQASITKELLEIMTAVRALSK
jgi:F-type H+-transporting ATPase subunit gamma